MRDQLLLLLELQKLDLRVRELTAAMQALPEKLRPVRQDLAKLEGMLEVERTRLAEAETWRRTQEETMKRDEEALRAARAKVQQSRGSKDFSAASREVDNRRRSISEREEEVLKVIDAIEKSRGQIAQREQDVQALRTQLQGEEAQLDERVRELQAEVTELTTSRAELAKKSETAALKLYETALGKRGYAIAPVIKGVCQGCHMMIPPQLNNVLARMERLENCPRCLRMIYRPDFLESKPAEDGSEPAPAQG